VPMTKAENLRYLKELFEIKEVTNGFPSQKACLSWSNKVAPLLRFNRRYYETFLHHLQIISTNVSSYTSEPAFRIMVNQVEMAIEELKMDATDDPEQSPSNNAKVQHRASVFKFEPNFHGIGINMNELFRRFKGWRKTRKS
jgi:hypothetical protein